MQVRVTDATTGITKQLTLSSVTFDVLDPVTNSASGTAPTGVPLGLAIGVPSGSGHGDTDPVVLGETAPANGGGNWSFDGAGTGTDITPSMQGFVCAIDIDGDCTGAGFGSSLK
jgi:hypothetical protein